jgi:DNA-binding transcriptional ArsR family regulator
MKTDMEQTWRGLSSPIRRRILDLIREGPRTTGELAEDFPELSRFAVMQHLGVLEESGLVVVRREGRRRLNYLNPVPLRQIYERWVSAHASLAADTTLRLKEYAERPAEGEARMERHADRVVKIETEVRIEASAEKVFAALTTEIGAWWPFRFREDSEVIFEPKVGGRYYEDWGEGGGALYAVVTHYEPPFKIGTSGPSALCTGYSSLNWDTIVPDGDGVIYRKSATLWGDVPEETEQMFREGSRAILEQHLKAYVEQGKGYAR